MPKVTVMSLPEESVQMLGLPKATKRIIPTYRVVWKNVVGKLERLAGDFCTRDVLIVSLLAFLLSRVVIMGEISPFGLAFFAAAAPYLRKRALICGAAAILGLASSGQYLECGMCFFAVFAYLRLAERLSSSEQDIVCAAGNVLLRFNKRVSYDAGNLGTGYFIYCGHDYV
jgi:stage II sporulation protein E